MGHVFSVDRTSKANHAHRISLFFFLVHILLMAVASIDTTMSRQKKQPMVRVYGSYLVTGTLAAETFHQLVQHTGSFNAGPRPLSTLTHVGMFQQQDPPW